MPAAFMYRAALLCEDCGEAVRTALGPAADTGDSDAYPQGPYSDGGGEADSPQHCDTCGVHLDNPLTPDGESYVQEAFEQFAQEGRGQIATLAEWRDAYESPWAAFCESVEPHCEHFTDLAQRRFNDLESYQLGARGLWVTHVRAGEVETQDFVPHGSQQTYAVESFKREASRNWQEGDSLEQYEGES